MLTKLHEKYDILNKYLVLLETVKNKELLCIVM